MFAVVSKCNGNTLETLQGESYHNEKLFEKQPMKGTIGNIEGVCLREMLTGQHSLVER